MQSGMTQTNGSPNSRGGSIRRNRVQLNCLVRQYRINPESGWAASSLHADCGLEITCKPSVENSTIIFIGGTGHLKREGVTSVLCPIRAPNCNAFAERFVRSIKDECLDRMILLVSVRFVVRSMSTLCTITQKEIIRVLVTVCLNRRTRHVQPMIQSNTESVLGVCSISIIVKRLESTHSIFCTIRDYFEGTNRSN